MRCPAHQEPVLPALSGGKKSSMMSWESLRTAALLKLTEMRRGPTKKGETSGNFLQTGPRSQFLRNDFFLLTVDNLSFLTYSWSFVAYSFSFFTYNWSFFAYSGKALLIRALRECKQRSLAVSKKAPTVSKKASPIFIFLRGKFSRKLEKAVAVSGIRSGVLEENCGKVPGKLLEKFSRIAKCYKF